MARRTVVIFFAAAAFFLLGSHARAQPGLLDMGLKQLLDLDVVVTSLSRKPQTLGDSAAAIYVLYGEDIRRSGVTTLPEALRMVPGLNVARISSDSWAVSVRGFNQRFAEKLLVLLDGQVIYTPFFGGTFWEVHEMNLWDIDRIEIIRGPGASIWGANAVNGVINIITKSANDTQGHLVLARGGTEDRLGGTVRQGIKLGAGTAARITGNFADRGSSKQVDDGDADDDWWVGSGEFRLDSALTSRDQFTMLGRAYHHDTSWHTRVPVTTPPFIDEKTFSGERTMSGTALGNIWEHTFSESSVLNARLDYQYEEHTGPILPLQFHMLTADVQHRVDVLERQEILYGTSFRFYHDATQGNYAESFNPASRNDSLVTGFIQSETSLFPDLLALIVGAKLEHNESTGFEYMPTGRLLLTPNDKNTIWTAVSRAIRHPTRSFEATRLPLAAFQDEATGLPVVVLMEGRQDLDSEELLAYELGYRAQLMREVFFDVAAFYNDYDRLNSLEPGEPVFSFPPFGQEMAVIVPLEFRNELAAQSHGVELSMDTQVIDWWRLSGSYSYLSMDIEQGQSADEAQPVLFGENAPRHAGHVRSFINLSSSVSLDVLLRSVGGLGFGDVPRYTELDVRTAWSFSDGWEVGFVFQNLLHKQHRENDSPLFGFSSKELERGMYVQVAYRRTETPPAG